MFSKFEDNDNPRQATKYGNVIADPSSDGARALLNKKVAFSYIYSSISKEPHKCEVGTLWSIVEDNARPFSVIEHNEGYDKQYTVNTNAPFIREVIEEPPKYRPYKDYMELVYDWYDKNSIQSSALVLPTITIRKKKDESCYFTICGGSDKEVFISHYYPNNYRFLLDYFTFLDGSPCGIKEG